uniref:Uncharacterized protein n=1 Tax=Rhizophora mucronata TaxID=61149 RepID=A0A2P2N9H7_RHIMU
MLRHYHIRGFVFRIYYIVRTKAYFEMLLVSKFTLFTSMDLIPYY